MRESAKPLTRGQWLPVEAGLFDLRRMGEIERVRVLADGRDHVLVEFRGQRHAIPKRRGFIGRPTPWGLRLRAPTQRARFRLSSLPQRPPTAGSRG